LYFTGKNTTLPELFLKAQKGDVICIFLRGVKGMRDYNEKIEFIK